MIDLKRLECGVDVSNVWLEYCAGCSALVVNTKVLDVTCAGCYLCWMLLFVLLAVLALVCSYLKMSKLQTKSSYIAIANFPRSSFFKNFQFKNISLHFRSKLHEQTNNYFSRVSSSDLYFVVVRVSSSDLFHFCFQV